MWAGDKNMKTAPSMSVWDAPYQEEERSLDEDEIVLTDNEMDPKDFNKFQPIFNAVKLAHKMDKKMFKTKEKRDNAAE